MRKTSPQFLRDAAWVMTFPPGTEWHSGVLRASREAELVTVGVLIPTEVEGVFTVAHVTIPEEF